MNKVTRKSDNVMFQDEHPNLGDSQAAILSGLKADNKTINPKWFYDERGSQLFDQITRLPEYYPTRTEVDILKRHCAEISDYCGTGCIFIEPGSGSSEKVRLLLNTLKPAVYVPVDISADFLEQSALALGTEYPWLDIHAVCADFNADWGFVDALPAGKRVVFYPGSTIGNLEPTDAIRFLTEVRELVGDDGGALVGVDTHKSSAVLNAAYNDSEGLTADFNLNILRHLNRVMDAEFDEASFSHRAFYNTDRQRIEMHLVSGTAQRVKCNGSYVDFVDGESIHTENSYKYTLQGFTQLAAEAGLKVQQSWTDAEELFSVHYLAPA